MPVPLESLLPVLVVVAAATAVVALAMSARRAARLPSGTRRAATSDLASGPQPSQAQTSSEGRLASVRPPSENEIHVSTETRDGLDEVGRIRSGVVPRGEKGLPNLAGLDDDDVDIETTKLADVATSAPSALPIVYDEEAECEEPTAAGALILTVGHAQTDPGKKRKRNEDSLLVSEKHHLYVVADGMGGHRGGDVASKLAVEAIKRAFDEKSFPTGGPQESLPRRANQLVGAIQRANASVLERATADVECHGMGTTVSAAKFSPRKQRLYIGHVGDSRVYRSRGGRLEQMTSDHTIQSLGFLDAKSGLLSRAVGVNNALAVDVVLAKPVPGDVYLLCSDGLTKMVSSEFIAGLLQEEPDPNVVCAKLVHAANESGGHDNVTVIVVRVTSPLSGQRVA